MKIITKASVSEINEKLEKQLKELDDINYKVCQCSQGFATINSQMCDFYSYLTKISNQIQSHSSGIELNSPQGNTSSLFSEDLVSGYEQTSVKLADFVSNFACKTLCDEFTTSKFSEIRDRFYQNTKSEILPVFRFHLPKTILYELHKTKVKFDASKYIQLANKNDSNQSSNKNSEDRKKIESEHLQKFLNSLDNSKKTLLERKCSLLTSNEDSITFSKYPRPDMFSKYPRFNQYLQIHSKLKNALDTIVESLQPSYVKIQRKQQQINILVSELSKLSVEMRNNLKNLEDIVEQFTNAECFYRKVSLINKAHQDYEFFDPSNYKETILKWSNQEEHFLKHYLSSSQNNNNSNSPSKNNTNEPLDVLGNRSDSKSGEDYFMLKSFFHATIKDCNRLDEDKQSLKNKLASKTRLEINFPQRYPRQKSDPEPILVRERKHFEDTTKSVNCAFECINTDIEHTISDLAKIEQATTAFSSIHSFLKSSSNVKEKNPIKESLRNKTNLSSNKQGNDFEGSFLTKATFDWTNQIIDEIKKSVEKKKQYLESLQKEISNEKEFKIQNVCKHQKAFCISNCGHTFCEECLNEAKNGKDSNEQMKCPNCRKPFSESDIVKIQW